VTRASERGLSLIEAIVIATITALLALVLMPLAPRTARQSFEVAERGVAAMNAVTAEREFRTLVRSVSPRRLDDQPDVLLEGDAVRVTLRPNLPSPIACAEAGAPAVRLEIVGDALICVSGERRRALLRWQRGAVGSLAYSRDGATWRAAWDEAGEPAYVRFELRNAGATQLVWIERGLRSEP
jgi:type II secretory pathway pseudopilin PulG